MASHLYLGVEGVGLRQSVAVLSDDAGRILSAHRSIGQHLSFHTIPRHVFRRRLTGLLRNVCQKVELTLADLRDATVCIGLTGVTFPHEAEVELPAELHEAELKFGSIACTGDVEIIFASHAQATTGSAIVCHMGSVVYRCDDGRSARLGGWGPAIGDEGSGYWIGRQVIKALAEEHDLRAPLSLLWDKTDRWLLNPTDDEAIADWREASFDWARVRREYSPKGFDVRSTLFSFAHALTLQRPWQWRIVLSGLVNPAMAAWRQGCPRAKTIVSGAARHLVRQYTQLSGHLT